MLLISNKGNITGPNVLLENTPEYIDFAIQQGYNVKIDFWYHNNKFFLGTNRPKTQIDWDWLTNIKRLEYLWINCMDTQTFSFLLENGPSLNFFYNKSDNITITSKGIPWSNITNQYTSNTITCNDTNIDKVVGVCSDWVSKWSKQIAICFYGDAGLPSKRIIKNHKLNLIKPLEEAGFHLEYYGSKILNHKETDLKYNEIYNFRGLRSHLKDSDKDQEEFELIQLKSMYDMMGDNVYETIFFIKWDQELKEEEIQNHIKTFKTNEES
jgi:hypothetical protein